jgi:hypothetical protein
VRKSIVFALLLGAAPSWAASNITAVWANNGEDKVTQDELRAAGGAAGVLNKSWDGTQINLFGGRNEVVAFNLVLEAAGNAATNVSVSFNQLSGPGLIKSTPASGDGVFDWTRRPIELFYVRYLPIKGLSRVSYEVYDERHIPRRMRRPWSGNGAGSGGWQDRPDHDKFYPDIAVPLELVPSFSIAARSNQSVWADVYIPKNAAPGTYQGTLTVKENGAVVKNVPVRLKVYNFTLPDTPSAKTMLYYSAPNINLRYLGNESVDPNSAAGAKARLLRDRHFLLAHRHKFSLIGDAAEDCGSAADQPCPEWIPRLDGSLFTAAHGYDGPGVNVGNNVYSIGTYSTWGWKSGGQSAMNQHTDAWASWFARYSPSTECFLYLIDESTDTAQIQNWAGWIRSNPGPGRNLRSMATLPLPTASTLAPDLDIPTSTMGVGLPEQWQGPSQRYTGDGRKRFYMYNGSRPAFGSTATDDDGVALRERAWVQYKLRINRWFFWETTYYKNYQGNTGQTDLFHNAHTFGNNGTMDPVLGESGWNHSNGDGVLLYPGTDTLYPADSYGVNGPFASLRLKYWRRGLQDVDYLTMAAAVNPAEVQSMVRSLVPKAGWEYGVSSPSDPTYVLSDISWPTDPDVWENARQRLAEMISGTSAPAATPLPPASVHPNPWRGDRHRGTPVVFELSNWAMNVDIFTLSGRRVRSLSGPAGRAEWDLTEDSGARAASGLYVYVIKASDGRTVRGKLGVIR